MTDCCPKCGNLRYDGTEAGYRSDRCHCTDVAPSIEGTATALTPATMRRGIEALQAGSERFRREMLEPVTSAAGATAYTVMDDARAAESGKQVLVTADDIRVILNQMLRVGQINSRQGDGSKPYAVFNKRDCAIKIAQVVNDRYNARRQP